MERNAKEIKGVLLMNRISFKKGIFVTLATLCLLTFIFAGSDQYLEASRNWKYLYEVYKKVLTHYSDRIDPAELAKAGVDGMLSELDPYTISLEREDREGIDMLTKGKYGGVGIQLGMRDDTLTVIAPMEDTPAKRAGILTGDRIVKIDGESTENMKLDEAAKKIRGTKGTIVVLTILRSGEDDLINFELTRESIKIQDIPYAGMIDDEIGYIRITRFSKNLTGEFKKSLLRLKEQGLSKLILDVRGNPGGLLESAIKILDMVTEKEAQLLETHGQSEESNRSYTSQSEPIISTSVQIAVLIDGGSASASEILAGAIQDIDRGVIIGTQSFGKGLVQSVFPLDREHSLKITTAKYYIPSGRLIQKPGYIRDELLIVKGEEDSLFFTNSGREVYAKGGITPDIEVHFNKVPTLTRECWRKGLFFKFASTHVKDYSMTLPVTIDDKIMSAFKSYISTKDIELKVKGEKHFLTLESELDSLDKKNLTVQHALNLLSEHFTTKKQNIFDKEVDFLTIGLEREISSVLGGQVARISSSFDDDRQILKALDVLNDQLTYHNTLRHEEL